MTTYILRRLLLMIPTLIGITFLVFMLVALSPGGLDPDPGPLAGASEGSGRAVREAYFEDRYGLRDPALIQYTRWLARVCPIKLGPRDLVDPTGAIVRPPGPLEPPPLAGAWYAVGERAAGPFSAASPDRGVGLRERIDEYRHAADDYARRRAGYIGARADLEDSLRRYAGVHNIRGGVSRRGVVAADRFRAEGFDPDDPAFVEVARAGERAFDEFRCAAESRVRLDAALGAGPFPEAGEWIIPGYVSLAAPDLGVSFARGGPVLALVLGALPATLLLNLVAFAITYAVAVPTGVLSAFRRGSWFDVTSGALFVALWSIPAVWAGVVAIGWLAGDRHLGWFPAAGLHDPDAGDMTFFPSMGDAGVYRRGYALDTLWHIALPVACLAYGSFAVLAKQTRAAVLESLHADHVRTARAKGVGGVRLAVRHVLRNSLLPLITMFAGVFPGLLSGSVVVEHLFSIHGMGGLVIDAINLRDSELLMADVLIVGVVNLAALLVADILYAAADPRISYDA